MPRLAIVRRTSSAFAAGTETPPPRHLLVQPLRPDPSSRPARATPGGGVTLFRNSSPARDSFRFRVATPMAHVVTAPHDRHRPSSWAVRRPKSVAMGTPAEKARGPGRGLGWSPVDVLEFAETANLVLQDPATWCGQTAAVLSRRIRSRFLARAPPAAGSKLDSGCDLDPGRWTRRTSRACQERWDTIKTAGIIYQ